MTSKIIVPQKFQVGDSVRVLKTKFKKARIAEYRGPLGVRGGHIYRVQVPIKPRYIYFEVPEDLLEPVG